MLVEAADGPCAVAEVLPSGIVLGNAIAARNVELLKSLGVRSVLNMSPQTVRTSKDFYDQTAEGLIVDYQEIWADDLLDYCIMDHFDAAWNSYQATLRHGADSKWFVHCEQGVNRSGAIATAIQMRLKHQAMSSSAPPQPGPADAEHNCGIFDAEELMWESWCYVATRRGGNRGAVTNTGFQRQLLLFARLGCQWWPLLPSISLLWRTPHERSMAAFRAFVQEVAWRVVLGTAGVPLQDRQFFATLIRDGAMRGESKLQTGYAFDLTRDNGARLRAEKRVTTYANRYIDKKVKAAQNGLEQAGATASTEVPVPLD